MLYWHASKLNEFVSHKKQACQRRCNYWNVLNIKTNCKCCIIVYSFSNFQYSQFEKINKKIFHFYGKKICSSPYCVQHVYYFNKHVLHFNIESIMTNLISVVGENPLLPFICFLVSIPVKFLWPLYFKALCFRSPHFRRHSSPSLIKPRDWRHWATLTQYLFFLFSTWKFKSMNRDVTECLTIFILLHGVGFFNFLLAMF